MKMKSIEEIMALTSVERINQLKKQVTTHECARKTAAKFLHVMIKLGDCAQNEINAYAKKHLGIDLRTSMQGVYQCLKVLDSILANELPGVTESDFDKNSWTANQELSKFLNPLSSLFLEKDAAAAAYKGEQPIKALKELAKTNKSAQAPTGAVAPPSPFDSALLVLNQAISNAPVEELQTMQQRIYELMVAAQERIDNAAPTVDVETVAATGIEAAAA